MSLAESAFIAMYLPKPVALQVASASSVERAREYSIQRGQGPLRDLAFPAVLCAYDVRVGEPPVSQRRTGLGMGMEPEAFLAMLRHSPTLLTLSLTRCLRAQYLHRRHPRS